MVLSTTQIRSANLKFIGALPSNVTVTISALSSAPGTTISGRLWIMQSQCSNSSAYTITVTSTVAGQQSICVPPYEPTSVFLEGTNSSQAGSIKFANLDRVGTFWDFIGSSVPNWVTGCTVPPYLNCDGTSFSSATYPALATILGGTTLPDQRGRFRATLNQSQSRITSGSSTGGVDGNTNLSAGGAQTVQLSSFHAPVIAVTDPGHTHNVSATNPGFTPPGTAIASIDATYRSSNNQYPTNTVVTGITAGASVAGTNRNFSIIPPAVIAGITMVRAG